MIRITTTPQLGNKAPNDENALKRPKHSTYALENRSYGAKRMQSLRALILAALCLANVYSWHFQLRGARSTARRMPLLRMTQSETEVEEVEEADTVSSAIKMGKTIAIFHPAELNISHSNPFGEEVRSLDDAAAELKHLVVDRRKELADSDFLKCRIEYLVKVLKQKYVPSFTVEFMNLAMSGDWSHQYSNVLLRRADASLNYRIVQKIVPEDSKIGEGDGKGAERLLETNNRAIGKVINQVRWSVVDNQDQLNIGELAVHANYTINSKGSLGLCLQDHVMNVEKLTLDPTELVMAIQKSIPFQFFDPTNSMTQNVYIDPDMRIAETMGPIFAGVYDIFVRDDGVPTASSADELETPPPGSEGGGMGFGKPKLRKTKKI